MKPLGDSAMKILVADDSKTNIALITASLHRLGHQVIPASSGEQAITLFINEHPDLIILDVVMEGMDGFECARKIRALESEDWIPIIFLSSSIDDVSIANGISAGGDDYIAKPFSEITLEAKIKAMQRIAEMRKKLYATTQELQILSATDPLTHLYNRLQFEKTLKAKLSEADRHKTNIALMYIDLDHFKTINDTIGHHIGDLLLIEVANRIKSCVRLEDVVARLGGDEFTVICSYLNNPEEAVVIAKKIIEILEQPYNLNNNIVRISACIGIAYYPAKGTNKENLIQNADIAMYHAKEMGRNNYQIYSKELTERYKQQLTLEKDLQFALEKKDLFINYQPIYHLANKNIIGIEALVRWQHAEFGLISPAIFIPLAEETGLILKIGDWVINEVIQQAASWRANGATSVKIYINLSLQQLLQDNFIKSIKKTLKECNFPAAQIEFELSENAFSSITPQLKNIFEQFQKMGVGLAIDNFGTHFPSLSILGTLPVSTLKIDKRFMVDVIKDFKNNIIVKSLVALGNNQHLNVIAEGIQSEEQLQFLLSTGCQQGQGFYLSNPLTTRELTELLLNKKLIQLSSENVRGGSSP